MNRRGRFPENLVRRHKEGEAWYAIWEHPDPNDRRKTSFKTHVSVGRKPWTEPEIVNHLPPGSKLLDYGPTATREVDGVIVLDSDHKDPLEPMNRMWRIWRKRRLRFRRKLLSEGKISICSTCHYAHAPEVVHYACPKRPVGCGRWTHDARKVPGYPEKMCRYGCSSVGRAKNPNDPR